MAEEAKIRGSVTIVLNRLMHLGVITRFSISFSADNGPGAPLVTITVPEEQSLDHARKRVMDDLADVVIGINVAVERA